VSTILDALKRVQRDREQARPMDLRESLTASEPSPRRKRSTRSGRWPLLIAVLVLPLQRDVGDVEVVIRLQTAGAQSVVEVELTPPDAF